MYKKAYIKILLLFKYQEPQKVKCILRTKKSSTHNNISNNFNMEKRTSRYLFFLNNSFTAMNYVYPLLIKSINEANNFIYINNTKCLTNNNNAINNLLK